jgi:hypothetical protein
MELASEQRQKGGRASSALWVTDMPTSGEEIWTTHKHNDDSNTPMANTPAVDWLSHGHMESIVVVVDKPCVRDMCIHI